MDHVRFALVGCSPFGLNYVNSVMDHPDAVMVAVCDLDSERARVASERSYGIPYFTDYYEMLKMGGFDCVIVATPDHTHCEYSVAALRAGCHVLCEKPLAPSLEECREIVRASEESGRLLMTGQVARKSPSFIKAKELIESGEIGEVFFIESEYAHNYGYMQGWRRDPAIPRHGILGGGCHALDIVRWLVGNPTEVIALSSRRALPDWPTDSTTVCIFKLPRGAVGKVFCSIGAIRKYTMRTCIYGTKGTVICDNISTEVTLYRHAVSPTGEHSYPKVDIPVGGGSKKISDEVAEMIDAILLAREVECDAIEGANTVALALAAIESAAKGGVAVKPRYLKRNRKNRLL